MEATVEGASRLAGLRAAEVDAAAQGASLAGGASRADLVGASAGLGGLRGRPPRKEVGHLGGRGVQPVIDDVEPAADPAAHAGCVEALDLRVDGAIDLGQGSRKGRVAGGLSDRVG